MKSPVEAGRDGGDRVGDNGVASKRSAHPFGVTVERVKALLSAKGITLFSVFDHSGEAAKVGIPMRPTVVLVFGNPRAGTPVMIASPSSAIDLPLKILVSEDAEGVVWLTYNAPAYVAERHGIPANLLAPLAAVEGFASAAAE